MRKLSPLNTRFAPVPGPPVPLTPSDFIAQHPVFHVSELQAFYRSRRRPLSGIAPTLGYHVQAGRLIVLRRGVYARAADVDVFLVGSRMTEDAVLAYDGAFRFFAGGSWGHHMTYLTARRARPSSYGDVAFTPITVPSRRGRAPELVDQVVELPHQGQTVRVTSYERTLVDLADRLDLAGEPLALFDRFQSKERKLDFHAIADRVEALDSQIVAGRVGLFLEGRTDVPTTVVRRLLARRPTTPAYLLGPSQRAIGGRTFGKWNVLLSLPFWERVVG